MTSLPKVAIIELGSQYTLVIERTLRELEVRSVILDPSKAGTWLKTHPVKLVILSGGAASVYDANAPQPPKEVLSLRKKNGERVPVLGICYGMQWMAHTLGGKVEPHIGEYGPAELKLVRTGIPFFSGTPESQGVWMSHGDSVMELPSGFSRLATTQGRGGIAAMTNEEHLIGVQFHPEVQNTRYGSMMLANLLQAAGCEQDWQPSSLVSSVQERALQAVADRRAIIGFSGGVDSTTLSGILSPVLKNRLKAVVIDGGQFREGELEEVKLHARHAGVKLSVIPAHKLFATALSGITDAEEKRRRFKGAYLELLKRAAKKFGAEVVVQGTLAPDRIESGATGAALIKSHHNVGLNFGTLEQIHPIDHLFKYEIRALSEEIGLPESVHKRQPFPGPGLFLRVVGFPATPANVEVVRWATARVQEILLSYGWYEDISQWLVAYVNVSTTGVKGDARVYRGAAVVRGIMTRDFMTARGFFFPEEAVRRITSSLTSHPKIVRAWYDPTDKPPATTEME